MASLVPAGETYFSLTRKDLLCKDLKVHVLPLLSDLSSKRSCFLTDLQVFQIAAEQLRGDRVQQRERGEQGGAEEERGGGPHLQVRQEEGE